METSIICKQFTVGTSPADDLPLNAATPNHSVVTEIVVHPVKSNGTAPTFEVVFVMVLPEGQQYQDTLPQKTVTNSVLLLRRSVNQVVGSGGRVHLLTNDDKVISAASDIPALNLYDFRREEPTQRLKHFRANYIHQSVNGPDYEALCMWRWILIADYMNGLRAQGLQLGRILALDTDILMLQDPRLMFSEERYMEGWQKMDSYMVVKGGAMAFSHYGLESFTHFLCDAYRSRSSAVSFVEKYGDKFPFCRPEKSLLIPCENDTMRHISDMYVLDAWYSANRDVRADHKHEERCIILELNSEAHRNLILSIGEDGRVQGALPETEPEPVCMIHFQGRNKRFIGDVVGLLDGDVKAVRFQEPAHRNK